MTVMIVDDNPHVRAIVRESFPPTDTIVECADGGEAIAVYETAHPDWVVMDVVMHPVNGLQALASIKSRHPDARIIMMTHFSDPQYRDKAVSLGATGFVPKDDLPRLDDIIRTAGV